MNKACKGLNAVQSTYEEGGEWDPYNLELETQTLGQYQEDAEGNKADWPDSWEGSLMACKAWFDSVEWNKSYCCLSLMFKETEWVKNTAVYNSDEVIDAEPISLRIGTGTLYAEAFKIAVADAAIQKLVGGAVLLSVASLMQ